MEKGSSRAARYKAGKIADGFIDAGAMLYSMPANTKEQIEKKVTALIKLSALQKNIYTAEGVTPPDPLRPLQVASDIVSSKRFKYLFRSNPFYGSGFMAAIEAASRRVKQANSNNLQLDIVAEPLAYSIDVPYARRGQINGTQRVLKNAGISADQKALTLAYATKIYSDNVITKQRDSQKEMVAQEGKEAFCPEKNALVVTSEKQVNSQIIESTASVQNVKGKEKKRNSLVEAVLIKPKELLRRVFRKESFDEREKRSRREAEELLEIFYPGNLSHKQSLTGRR